MWINRVQFQKGLSMAEFLERLRNRGSVPFGAGCAAVAGRFRLSRLRLRATLLVRARRASVLAVPRLPDPVHRYLRHRVRSDQAAVDALVRRNALG
jgi:hypothetical protein